MVCYGLMLPMSNSPTILINGSFNQSVSPLDRGLAYGDGVFRTLKVVDGLPVNWPLHYQKLVADCSALGIVCPSAELLMSDFQQLFTPDETKAVAKIIITRGEGERGYKPPAVTMPMRVMIKANCAEYPENYFTQGVNVYLCDTRLAEQPKLAGIKHLNRLENVLARMEWNDPEFADGLMLDTSDHVIECTAANIFARFNDTLITPKLEKCGVSGITRERIIALAYTLNLKVQISSIALSKLLTADEIIICNSLYGAWQVHELGNKSWPALPLAAKLRDALQA